MKRRLFGDGVNPFGRDGHGQQQSLPASFSPAYGRGGHGQQHSVPASFSPAYGRGGHGQQQSVPAQFDWSAYGRDGHGQQQMVPAHFVAPAYGRDGHGQQHMAHARFLGPVFPAHGTDPSPYGPAPGPSPSPIPGPGTEGCVIHVHGPLMKVAGCGSGYCGDIDYASAQLGLSRDMATRASASCGCAAGAPAGNMYY